jgi:ABC-2 type transport system permease protein
VRKVFAFIKRDVLVTLSYRFSLVLSLGSAALSILLLYFVSKVFSGGLLTSIAHYGGDYFPYALVGVAVSTFITVGLDTLADQIRAAQVEGTLEALMTTPTSIYTILLGNSLSTFLAALGGAMALIGGGFALVGLAIPPGAAAVALLILILTLLAFLSLGVLSAGFIMIFKRGNPISYVFGWSSFFLGGIFFPVETLPTPLRFLSNFLPATHATRAIREVLLTSAPPRSALPLAGNLCTFIAIVAPLAIVFFRFAVRRAKSQGSLIQF